MTEQDTMDLDEVAERLWGARMSLKAMDREWWALGNPEKKAIIEIVLSEMEHCHTHLEEYLDDD